MSGAFDAGTATGRLVLDLQQWTASVEMAKKDTQSLAGLVSSKKDEIEKLGKAFTAVGVAIVGALGLAVKSAVDYTLEIGRMSVKTGIATETLSGLAQMADKSGMSLDELGIGMRRLSSLAFDASQGNKAASDTLARLGVSATDTTGKLKPMDQLLMETADKFKVMPNGVEKSALAIDLFGRSGTTMIAMLNRGSDGLREFMAEAKDSGQMITNEGVAKAKAFSYSLKDLDDVFMGIKLTIANAIMPVVKAVAEAFGFVANNIRKVLDIFPPLGNTIVVITGAFGALAAIVGPLLFMLPKMAAGWAMIAGGIPVLQARLAALGTSLGFLGIAIAAAVVAAQTLTWAIGKYSDACDRAIGDTMRTAGEVSKGWKYAAEVMKGTDKDAAASMRSMIDRMRQVGFNSEQIGQRIFDMNQKAIGSMKSLVPVTAEMAKAIKTVQETLTDKLKELTLNEYGYRIYQAKKYYDDLKVQAQAAGSDAKTLADIERAQALEISKIKKEQAEAQAEAHKRMVEKNKKSDADYVKKFYEYTGQEGKTWSQLYFGMTETVQECAQMWLASYGVFSKAVAPKIDEVKKKFLGFTVSSAKDFGSYLEVMQQGFSSFFSNLGSLADANLKSNLAKLDTEHEARKKWIMANVTDIVERDKQLAALDEDTAAKKRKLEHDAAKKKKEMDIFQAIGNMAVAITASWKLGWPLGAIGAALAAIACAIQVAAIKRTPLPALAEGGIADRPTAAIFGEAGPEAILPLKELGRMLGIKGGNRGGNKSVTFGNISAIDSRGLRALFSEEILPMIKRAMGNESLTVPVKAVR